jgi:hypothetical protein
MEPPPGLASRTDEMLLFFRPLSVTLAYIPGLSVPRLVPFEVFVVEELPGAREDDQ